MKILISLMILASSVLTNSHDISSLSFWGPYSKRYCGVSHIEDINSGRRVDFTLVPGIYRRNVLIPDALFESSCYPWSVSADMRHITYRYELEWKDRLYIDATYHILDENLVLLQMHCVNSTSVPQNITVQNAASLQYAEDYPSIEARGASGIVYGPDYSEYEPVEHRHDYNLVYNGWMRGEVSDANSLSGTVLETSGARGDRIVYQTPISEEGTYLRCRSCSGSTVRVNANSRVIEIGTGDGYALVPVSPQNGRLCLETMDNGKIRIDAVLTGDNVSIAAKPLEYIPEVTKGEGEYIVKYKSQNDYYGVAWNYPYSQVREFENSDLDVFMRRTVHNHVDEYFKGDGNGHFTASFLRPVVVRAGADTTLYSIIANGDRDYVAGQLELFHKDENAFISRIEATQMNSEFLEKAAEYALPGQLMQASLLTNIVYPVYTQRQYIRHFTPGKNWNSLYTWDLGFISWALSQVDPVKSFESVRAYTTEAGAQSAFIHHGTPAPIQFFAFEDLYNKTSDDAWLEFLYPRLKQYYDFMAGNNPESATRMKSGLIRTWDYFYNSGGWDDYPPQHYLKLHPEGYPYITPMVSTSFYIRAAKILRLFADKMGKKADVKQYDRDIERMSKAVLDNAWDEEKGYFGYVRHDDEGNPDGIFRYADGTDFNMGLDGVTPLAAGICTIDQERRLVDHIFTKGELWSDAGVSTVDQTAPYFRIDGYWNGCVWMPHQLILWKTMLDLGRADLAEKIAFTALDNWKRETEESYQCYEHFMISTGRGGGWHNFSGLSSPVINWFYSYFKPGTATAGFNTLICNPAFGEEKDSFSADLRFDKDAKGDTGTMIICLNPDYKYKASLNGKAASVTSPYPGLVYVDVPVSGKGAELVVTRE